MSNIYLLDATLRDGSYINNFNHSYKTIHSITSLLNKANIDIIEIGFLGKSHLSESTKFKSIEDAEAVISKNNNSCEYAIMLNYAERNQFNIKQCVGSIKIIRLAFFKFDCDGVLEYTKELMNLGYLVSLQLMATHMYSVNELNIFIKNANKIKPFAFYLVDSFGTFFNSDIEYFYSAINSILDLDVIFGLHCHNNMQQAVSNTIKFIEIAEDRKIAIDTTIFGMGRGAGNATTELLMQYLNDKKGKNYNISKILDIYNDYLYSIYQEVPWGYSIQYFISAQKKVNPVYIWYLNNKHINELNRIIYILDLIPENSKHYLDKKTIDKIIEDMV